jgi:hypothetical protein
MFFFLRKFTEGVLDEKRVHAALSLWMKKPPSITSLQGISEIYFHVRFITYFYDSLEYNFFSLCHGSFMHLCNAFIQDLIIDGFVSNFMISVCHNKT